MFLGKKILLALTRQELKRLPSFGMFNPQTTLEITSRIFQKAKDFQLYF